MIQYKDAVQEIERQDHKAATNPFSITFIKANRSRKEAGEIVHIAQAVKCGLPFNCKDNEMRGIIDLATGKRTAVHLRLIIDLNGQEIFW